jgi:hypothetical protein
MPFILFGFVGRNAEAAGMFDQDLSETPENKPRVPPERSEHESSVQDRGARCAHPTSKRQSESAVRPAQGRQMRK